ncbi:MAG TPA: PEGA domain-containing protein [Terriglobales bacterium]|nr:PEGA domain-containing protein [Terriglobales bacterium]
MNRARSWHWEFAFPFVALYVAVSVISFEPTVHGEQNRPRVFITDSESWEIVGSAAGSGGTFAAHTQGGARPQTAEIIKTFGERCQQVLVNNKQEKADYVVVLDHEGGKGYLRRRNKIAVFNKEGDAIVSRSTRSLGNSVQDACNAIVVDWSAQGAVAVSPTRGSPLLPSTPSKPQPETHPAPVVSAAKRDPETSVQPALASATTLEKAAAPLSVDVGTVSVTSDPDGAEIFIDSVGYGHAPAILKLPRGKHAIQLVTQGYKDWTSNVEVRENSIVNVTANFEK